MNNTPKFRLIRGCGRGSGIHRLNASVRDSVGAIKNRETDVEDGRKGSFVNNFMASANGWNIP